MKLQSGFLPWKIILNQIPHANMRAPSSDFKQLARTPTDHKLEQRDSRLQSLKALAGKLSHDVNNFLAPVLGYVALINEESASDLTIQQYAQAIESSTRKTEQSIECILNAVRPQRRFRPKQVELSVILREELEVWKENLPNSTKVEVSESITEVQTCADPEQWRKLFQNLLQNAHFALATGGKLEVELRYENLDPARTEELGLAEDLQSGYFKLRIKDSGFGMPESVLSKALDPMFTTRSKGQGMGLGLTQVHSVTRLHGGQVLLNSMHDEGAEAIIYAPVIPESWIEKQPDNVSEDDQEGQIQGAESGSESLRKSGKVLLVDDDPMVLEVIKACLTHEKFEMITARNGEEGIRLFRRNEGKIALIVSDITMPKKTGIDLVREVRQGNTSIPILLISGDAEAAREEALLSLPEPRPTLLHKPFSLKELMEAMEKKFREAS